MEQSLKERSSRDFPTRHPSHMQTSHLDAIVDAMKCLLMETSVNHWTERTGVPDGIVGEGTEGTEEFCSFMEGATVSTGQMPHPLGLLGTGPKNTCGRTHGFGLIYALLEISGRRGPWA